MSKVVLHIGTHKTATTTIQNRFWAFAPQLEEHGLIYPRLNQITGHHGLVCDWVPLPEVYHLPKGSTETLRDLGKQYGNRDVTVFLSSEEFSRGEPKGGVDYAALRSALSDFDEIEVIAVLRTQWEFMQSVYLELSKNRVPPEPDKLLPPTFKRGLFAGLWADYNLLLDRLEAVFAPEEITLFDFNDCRSAEGGILGSLLTHLGVSVSPETLTEMTAASSNISPLSLASWAANMLSDPNPAPPELVEQMGQVLREFSGEDVNPCLFTRAEFDRLKTHFDVRNTELAKRRAAVQPGFAITPASAEGLTLFRNDIDAGFWLRAGRSLAADFLIPQPASDDAPTLPTWQDYSAHIAADIRARRAPFKIVLHTRNDAALSDWVAHHAAIVGYEGLIIADNMSDDPEVLEQLQDLAGRSCVFRFEGDRDALHDRAQYPDLFAAIEASSGWMTMIAADERLIWAEADGSWIADQRILDKLAERGTLSALPAVLLDNFGSNADRFIIPPGKNGLAPLVRRGKPVIRSGAGIGPGVKCHNTEFEKSLFDPHEPAHFFQLRLQNLPPETAPQAQSDTPAVQGVSPSATSERDSAAAIEVESAPGLLQRARRKVRRLLNGKAAPGVEDTIRLRPDGTIDATAALHARFGELITRSAALLDAMPRSEHPENRQ